jgi:hypothetical protein
MADFDALLCRLRTLQAQITKIEETPDLRAHGREYGFLLEETRKLRAQMDKLRPGWDDAPTSSGG